MNVLAMTSSKTPRCTFAIPDAMVQVLQAYDVIYVNYVKYKGHVNYVILNVPVVPDVNEISILNRKLQKKHAF